jgi:DNA-binding NtrC family response regulator
MKVLVFDPVPESRDALRRAFAARGGAVKGYAVAEEAARAVAETSPDVVVADFGAAAGPDSLLQAALSASPRPRVYAIVESDRLEDAVAAVERGADDFLWRPVSDARVAQLWAAAEETRRRDGEAEETRRRLARAELRDALPGRSPRWISALAALERAASANASVLLTGETGTEKDTAALALHRLSPRGAGRFAYVTEGESLDLATLQIGRGTLFLPSVEATSGSFQEMLLRHVEGPRPVRFVVALDEDPVDALDAGRLHRRLYDDLSAQTVHLPPLREREGDVALLAERILDDVAPELSIEADALDALEAHDWPGNTRELREVLRRAARLCSGETIGPTVVRSVIGRPLPRERERRRKPPVVKIAVGDSLADVERRLISKTLEFARGNKKKTAELLKLSLKTIYNKIKEYGLEH